MVAYIITAILAVGVIIVGAAAVVMAFMSQVTRDGAGVRIGGDSQ